MIICQYNINSVYYLLYFKSGIAEVFNTIAVLFRVCNKIYFAEIIATLASEQVPAALKTYVFRECTLCQEARVRSKKEMTCTIWNIGPNSACHFLFVPERKTVEKLPYEHDSHIFWQPYIAKYP